MLQRRLVSLGLLKNVLTIGALTFYQSVLLADDVAPGEGDSFIPLSVVQDRLDVGALGPEMIDIPVGGKEVSNCIGKRHCDVSITEIVSSMVTKPYAISRFEITFDQYDLFAEVTNRRKPEDFGWGPQYATCDICNLERCSSVHSLVE